MLLYAVTDRAWVGEYSLKEQIELALLGGVTMLQLREKELEFEQFLQEAYEIGQLAKKYQVPFIINDNVEIAKQCNADGVHIGQHDINITFAKKILGKDKIIGVSAQTVEQALLAQKEGANYLGVGAAFATTTKSDAKPISHKVLRQICEAVSIPVVAIGGIQKENIKQLKGTKIAGVAVVSAIFGEDDITKAAKEMKLLAAQIIDSD